MSTDVPAGAGDLTPYVPRLALEWELDAGGASWRALEGSLIFLDISGFTKMSERLARFGKLGAEEVTETLNSTFARLLDLAYGEGGSLLKFGGDALLLWFAGPGHAARAAGAAHDLRAELRSLGRIQTSAGFVQLRMSVGVHTGTFHFFLCGASHRELVVTGPGVTETVSMEHDASAGEILISPALAATLDRSSVGAAKGPGYLLRRRPAMPAAGVEARRPGSTGAGLFVSSAIRAHVGGGAAGAEHRQVAVAFVHFDGTDARIAAGDVDGVAADLDGLVRACQAASDEYGLGFIGTDVDADGGKVILVAGAPRSIDLQEEAILRACRRVLDESPPGLEVRIGVHRGHVFAGDVGTPYRRTYTVMGDAVNTAARVMSRAGAGELLATPDVFHRSPARFELEPLEPFAVKGKAKPLEASRVGALLGVRVSDQLPAGLPLVGRDDDVARIEAAIAASRAGTGSIVEVVAEAGMGKTRLLEEVRARAEGVAWLTTTCEHYERSTPYFAVRALLRAITGISPEMTAEDAAGRLRDVVRQVAPHLEPWMPLLAIPLDIDVPSTPEVDALAANQLRPRTHAVTYELLHARVTGPGVWVVDDAHWMDEASIAFLELVASRVAGRPWTIVLARWPGTPVLEGTEGVIHLALEPLSTDASVELARAAADGVMLPQDAFLVADRAGGSPLFVQELARTVAAEGGDALPETVESLLATRIDDLSPEDRELIQTAAVLGRRGSRRLLEGVFESASSTRHVRSIPGFLSLDGTSFRLEHGLVREVAYERLPYRRRRQLHLRAAAVAEASESGVHDVELLSLHFHHGGDSERAWRYARMAAERAQAKQAFTDAVTFWRRALEATRRIGSITREDLVTAWISLGDALMRSGRLADAPNAYAAARRLADESDLEARLCLLEGEARRALGQPLGALRWYRRGIAALDAVPGGGDAKNRVRLQLGCALIEMHRGRYAEAIGAAHDARSAALAAGDHGGLGHSCNVLLLAGTAIGDPAAEAYGQQALEAFTAAGLRMNQGEVLCNLGDLARTAGRWDEAVDLLTRSREALVECGEVVGAAAVEHNLAEILSDQGRLDEARRLLESALATFRGARSHYIAIAQTQFGRLAARAGDFGTAAAVLGEATDALRSLGAAQEVSRAMAFEAERLLFAGEHAQAEELAGGLLESAPASLRPLIHRVRGCALAELGRAGDARVTLLEGLQLATAGGDLFERALLLGSLAWTAAEAGQPEESEAYEAESLATMQSLGVTTPAIHRALATPVA